jgi:hypothetical protein
MLNCSIEWASTERELLAAPMAASISHSDTYLYGILRCRVIIMLCTSTSHSHKLAPLTSDGQYPLFLEGQYLQS